MSTRKRRDAALIRLSCAQDLTALMSADDLVPKQRIRVWWEADSTWFAGVIVSSSRMRGKLIKYDPVPGEDDRCE